MLDNDDFKMDTCPRELTQNPLRKIWLPYRNGHIAQRRGKTPVVKDVAEVMRGVCRESGCFHFLSASHLVVFTVPDLRLHFKPFTLILCCLLLLSALGSVASCSVWPVNPNVRRVEVHLKEENTELCHRWTSSSTCGLFVSASALLSLQSCLLCWVKLCLIKMGFLFKDHSCTEIWNLSSLFYQLLEAFCTGCSCSNGACHGMEQEFTAGQLSVWPSVCKVKRCFWLK